eukprot:354921-Chlamydomonas_euryale.AAC.4
MHAVRWLPFHAHATAANGHLIGSGKLDCALSQQSPTLQPFAARPCGGQPVNAKTDVRLEARRYTRVVHSWVFATCLHRAGRCAREREQPRKTFTDCCVCVASLRLHRAESSACVRARACCVKHVEEARTAYELLHEHTRAVRRARYACARERVV